ncbi:MAG: hypothetical protein AAF611_14265 [Bacteroidota bacterium]
MKRFVASVLFLFITCSCFSQELNNYKYVVIPYKFNFLKKHDKYRVNTVVRYLFKKEGFQVLYDTEDFPTDLSDDRCKALYMDINNESSIFTTKMAIVLRDCANKVVLETPFGRSKIKAYEKAYNQALRKAFETVEAQNYSYDPKKKEEVPPPPPPITVEEAQKKTEKEVEASVIEMEDVSKEVEKFNKDAGKEANTILYAQPIKNGYQLVDKTPKVVMILLKSGVPNVYIVKGQDATVYKEDGKWFLSKTSDNSTVKMPLSIKF